MARAKPHYKSSVDFPGSLIGKNFLEGIVAVGGRIDSGTLFHAYSRGIYPWPHEGLPNLWFCPDSRGILDFNKFHVPSSLKKFRKKNTQLNFTINQNFKQVIRECAKQARPGQKGSWINREILRGFQSFFDDGYVQSLEVWDSSTNEMVGGIYGVLMNGVFSGESMFFKKPNASKLALWFLIERLSSLGLTWMDTQMVTPVLESFGAEYIPRDEFLGRLSHSDRPY